ncbi:hypothetical protein [Microbulbifer sp. A4B17]|uniref:hypothetical protein n=1 Tax=Microbulbifer sp. A4B17 TaxID=359370 RepID=UPI0013008076|nr:hypothetical protein [Microbulbifer sp. A4B17]
MSLTISASFEKSKKTEFWYKDKKHPYGVFELGAKSPVYRCLISEYANDFICHVGVGEFFFSPESGRFIKTYTAGYWNGENNNENTPNVTRGRCSKI